MCLLFFMFFIRYQDKSLFWMPGIKVCLFINVNQNRMQYGIGFRDLMNQK